MNNNWNNIAWKFFFPSSICTQIEFLVNEIGAYYIDLPLFVPQSSIVLTYPIKTAMKNQKELFELAAHGTNFNFDMEFLNKDILFGCIPISSSTDIAYEYLILIQAKCTGSLYEVIQYYETKHFNFKTDTNKCKISLLVNT